MILILRLLIVGLIAGWLAGKVMKGGGYGVLMDIVLGILGGIVGGWIFGALNIWPGGGIIGGILVAFVGAVLLVWITRLIKKASRGFERGQTAPTIPGEESPAPFVSGVSSVGRGASSDCGRMPEQKPFD